MGQVNSNKSEKRGVMTTEEKNWSSNCYKNVFKGSK